eukprot:COSAG02_NODE_26661_length_628_cov_0.606805_2_plen_27_part_01
MGGTIAKRLRWQHTTRTGALGHKPRCT